jgi:glycosyltransferase involved in cell wall biosynthesis
MPAEPSTMAPSPRPSVLFISRAYPPDVGGIQTHNHELAVALGELTRVRVVANGRGRAALGWFLPWAAIRTLATAWRYDVVLLGDGLLAPVGRLTKLLRPKTCVATVVHGLDLTWQPRLYQRFWVRRWLRSLDLFMAVSSETRRVAIEAGLPAERVGVVPNGVSLRPKTPHPDAGQLAAVLGRDPTGHRLMLSTGRLVKRKGVAWFAEHVLPLVPDDVLYVVAGDGTEREPIAEAAARADMTDRVLLLGRVSDEARDLLFAGCDVFVQPNIAVPGDMEGFGIVVLEAAAAGMPVVAARLEGLIDAVEDGTNGVLVTSGDAEGFRVAVDRLLADKRTRTALGRKAERFVRETYAWPGIAARYLDLLQTCLERREGRAP